MKTLRNLHTRCPADIDLSRDGAALADLLAEAETSGRYWLGKDPNNHKGPETAEAGLFQASYDSLGYHPRLRKLFNQYQKDRSGLIEVFREGVPKGWQKDHGTGEVAEFQRVSKDCPSFSVEYVALGIRVKCSDWWPIKYGKTEFNPDADAMLKDVEDAIDKMGLCRQIGW